MFFPKMLDVSWELHVMSYMELWFDCVSFGVYFELMFDMLIFVNFRHIQKYAIEFEH